MTGTTWYPADPAVSDVLAVADQLLNPTVALPHPPAGTYEAYVYDAAEALNTVRRHVP